MATCFLIFYLLAHCCIAFCPQDLKLTQELQSKAPVIITGKVASHIQHPKCSAEGLQFNKLNDESDAVVVQLACENKGAVNCIQGLQSEGCFVVVQGVTKGQQCEQAQQKQLLIGQFYTFFLIQENFDGCSGVYSVSTSAGITEHTEKYGRNEFGICPPKLESLPLKSSRQLLQQSGDDEKSSEVQCGLFAVDISYCGSDGLVTDQQSAKIVLACNSSISGICSSCITVSGPKDGSISYVSSVDNTSSHFEIHVKWDDKDYQGPVQVSTEKCNLIREQDGEPLKPVVPMRFNSVEKVMVRPTAYRINYDL
eukprot:TRINITY_DN17877_c0_g2_i2.p1 TRINITY_DN17877_c0_g2~~TRINITY_DN17877_c0_g2_i2.p1  ORF type:complete len:310 (+),score=25.40 TRINITY_DN17877_c0_g2_i2:90-1019(+)